MKLEIKHIAPYLPYGLRCKIVNDDKELIGTLNGLYADCSCVFDDIVESEHGFESVKPLLKPLSELPVDRYGRIIFQLRNGTISNKEFTELVSEHYDVFNLIDNGLAEVKG